MEGGEEGKEGDGGEGGREWRTRDKERVDRE